jgi:transposase
LAGKFLTSRNSSKPPSNDPNRKKKNKIDTAKRPGGQPGREGVNLQPSKDPDRIIDIKVDKRKLPRGDYHDVGFESRQIIDIEISKVITEYRAQILEDKQGQRYVAEFPKNLTRPIQYGDSIKSHAVYMSQFQLLPYERVSNYFVDEMKIPLSIGSLFNFNQEVYKRLEAFDELARKKLSSSLFLHADETGINVKGKRLWLHSASNDLWTYFFPHEKRGNKAMDEIGILPKFRGVLIHDHWKPYYIYQSCQHALCNAHHLRELQWVEDNYSYVWPKKVRELLLEIHELVKREPKNSLDTEAASKFRKRYRKIIQDGLAKMPLSKKDPNIKKKGREKKTKERNLLERLRDFEDDVLRFMEIDYVPFTNNRGENDIRMTKVQQKISGCFKSIEGAKIFCRVRSYLLTSQKHGISPTDALKLLFQKKLPEIFNSS